MKIRIIKFVFVFVVCFLSGLPVVFAATGFDPSSGPGDTVLNFSCDFAEGNYIYIFDQSGNIFDPWGSNGASCAEMTSYLTDQNCNGSGGLCSASYLFGSTVGDIKSVISDQDSQNYCGNYTDCVATLSGGGYFEDLGTIFSITGETGGAGGTVLGLSTSTVSTSIINLTHDTMGIVSDTVFVVIKAFAILVAIAFSIYIFRKHVFKKKV